MIAAVIGREIRRHEDVRRPQVGRRWVIKAVRHDADHLAGSAVNGDIFADYLGVGAKDTLPQPIAEDDNAIVALFLFIGRKRAAEVRVYAEEGEKTRRNGCTVEAPRISADNEVVRSRADQGEIGKAAVLLSDVTKLRRREPVLIVGQPNTREMRPDLHHAAGVRIRQELLENWLDHGA